jgi:2-C-methyl-D-erythritol 4-phosphate cytidylyltransferase
MNKYALVVAGGKGLRMGPEIPKQFILLKGMPVLMHTLKAFRSIEAIQLILVLPKDQIAYWKQLCINYKFELPHQIIAGGDTRFQSVKNGLQAIEDNTGLVAIHDGVRPLISVKIIEESFDLAQEKGNALTVVALKDSIRKQTENGSKSINRSDYFLVQTPQTFKVEDIKNAYNKAAIVNNFTDDASVFEANGGQIQLVQGDYKNIKITTSEDLLFANALLKD